MTSIIVPVYNVEFYLRECIESILSQSFSDWELILVDDGSTDSSGDICDRYAKDDTRIRVIHSRNGGLSRARNRGIEAARGEYLTFVDGDDALYPDALLVMHKVMSECDVDLVEGEFRHGYSFDSNTKHIDTTRIYSADEAVADVLYQTRLLPSAWGKLYRSRLFDGLTYTEGLYYEDLDIFYRIFFRCEKIAYIQQPVYFYRITPGSILHTWSNRRIDVLNVTEKIENYMAEHHTGILPAARDRRLSANFNIYALAANHKENDVAARCWGIIRKYRRESLFNPHVRFKNKAGIILSFFGKRVFALAGRIVYK